MTMTSRCSFAPGSLALLAALAFVAGCGLDRATAPTPGMGPTAPTAGRGTTQSSPDDPTFLMASSSAPAIANPVITFWAKKGVDTTVFMYYHARPGHHDSTTFMRFRVRSKSLVTRPDGSLLANGDSLLITVTLANAAALQLDFQPSGLQFSSHDQAVLEMSYGEAAPFGVGNVQALSIWKRESPLDPWLRLSSVVIDGTDDVQADIAGFTGYAMAY